MKYIVGKNVTLSLPHAHEPLLKDINFKIDSGVITVLLGVSGSGKTTLLKCIAGLINTYEGIISYNDTPLKNLSITDRVAYTGYVSQHYQLFPHMTVMQNCNQPQTVVLGKNPVHAIETTNHILQQFELAQLTDRFPRELSGGQQQRVAIARALVMGSQTLLLDEPTSALDPKSTQKLKQLLDQLKKDGYTIVVATHDISFAQTIMDNAILMETGSIIEECKFNNKQLSQKNKIYTFMNTIEDIS